MGSAEVNAFLTHLALTHLAVEGRVSASTQNQALWQRRRLKVVLSEAEVRAVRRELEGDSALVVGLLYGSGLRL
jgi:integrase